MLPRIYNATTAKQASDRIRCFLYRQFCLSGSLGLFCLVLLSALLLTGAALCVAGEPPPPPLPNSEPSIPISLASTNLGESAGGDDKENGRQEREKKGEDVAEGEEQRSLLPRGWNFHAQATAVVDFDPGFRAKYSGPNSLNSQGERQETLSTDLFAGAPLWNGAELHADLLMWQGFGLSNTFGVEAFPSGDAFKAGMKVPDFMLAHFFVRQTVGLGGEQEDVPDGQLTLKGRQDVSRLTFTVGRFSPSEICDNNTYAHDAHTQFLNWAAGTNLAWDYPADAVGYTTGLAVELNQPDWALRYGWFQMPGLMNGFTADDRIFMWPSAEITSDGAFWRSWGMMTELERRWKLDDHPGAIRLLAWLDQARFASFAVATALLRITPPPPDAPQGAGATIPPAAFDYRYKYGFGLNWEQEIAKNVGLFSRLGWNDGHEAAWAYTDANWSVSLGTSIKGAAWCRSNDTLGLAGVLAGASRQQIEFLKAGGTGILNGDGNLSYDCEKVLEAYYDIPIGKVARFAVDYQFVGDPAFNRDRGPVSVFGVRLHWEQ
jgi:high affinity Mn2+ porin